MTLLSKVGGASGPLYGSFFMKAGTHLDGEHEVDFKGQFAREMIQAELTEQATFRGGQQGR